jgi:OOP family OmpA-OmpF porin
MRKRTLITASLLTWAGLANAGLLEDAREAARLIKERTKKAEPAPAPQPNAEAPTRAGSPQKGPVASDGLDEAVYSRYDFVPGDKVIFFDDFGDTDVGEFPLKWHLKGPKDQATTPSRWCNTRGSASCARARAPPGATSPVPRSTCAWSLKAICRPGSPSSSTPYWATRRFRTTPINTWSTCSTRTKNGWSVKVWGWACWLSRALGAVLPTRSTALALLDGKVHHVAISVNGTFVKAYVDHQRVVNDPDAIVRPIRRLGLSLAAGGRIANERVMITNFRLAEGGKDVKAALTTEGRIVTHGILFDTGSDRIKSESLPTLKAILGLLQSDPKLRFSVEGHTDDQGGKAINQPLSERRAAAVMAWLAGKGIAPTGSRPRATAMASPSTRTPVPKGAPTIGGWSSSSSDGSLVHRPPNIIRRASQSRAPGHGLQRGQTQAARAGRAGQLPGEAARQEVGGGDGAPAVGGARPFGAAQGLVHVPRPAQRVPPVHARRAGPGSGPGRPPGARSARRCRCAPCGR